MTFYSKTPIYGISGPGKSGFYCTCSFIACFGVSSRLVWMTCGVEACFMFKTTKLGYGHGITV